MCIRITDRADRDILRYDLLGSASRNVAGLLHRCVWSFVRACRGGGVGIWRTDPEPVPFERVGRQRNAAPPMTLVERDPIRLDPGAPQLPQRELRLVESSA